jgi:hypothetical protein
LVSAYSVSRSPRIAGLRTRRSHLTAAVVGALLLIGGGIAFADTPGTNLTVTPSANLDPTGHTAAVSGTGFGDNGTGTIRQCVVILGTEACSENLGTFTTNAFGLFGPTNVTVTANFTAESQPRSCSAATPCSLYASMNAGPENAHEPIAFATSKPAVVRTSTTWILRTGTTGGADLASFTYGIRPNVPLLGDWDGNGSKTVGSFELGVFKLNNANDSSGAELSFPFGDARGFPVAGDFNGDGIDDVGVFRNGTWRIHYLGTGVPADASFTFGPALSWPSVVPLAGDWNGDGVDGIGIYNAGAWSLKHTVGTGVAALTPTFAPGVNPYPVVGDWDGNGTDTVGVKSRTGTTWQLSNSNDPPAVSITFDFGQANTDLPLSWY